MKSGSVCELYVCKVIIRTTVLDACISISLISPFMIQYFLCDNIKVLCNNTFISNGNTCFNLSNMPIVSGPLFNIFSVLIFQIRLMSKVNNRKLNSSTLSIYTSSVFSF